MFTHDEHGGFDKDLGHNTKPNAPLVLACVFSAGEAAVKLNLSAPGILPPIQRSPRSKQKARHLWDTRTLGFQPLHWEQILNRFSFRTKFHH